MEMYEEWDVTLPSIPSRNRLYHLEPIGVGTPNVESLTSYVARLAERHSLIPKTLITQVILPLQGKVDRSRNYYYRLNKFWYENALTLNGVSPIANEWVEALQTLTGVRELRFLTMLTFCEVIAMSRLLRRRKAWCPHCFEEWRCHKMIVYEPLVWSLNGIDVCFQHQQSLMTHCPQCSRTLPMLTQSMRPGYCPHCTGFLGTPQKLSERDECADMEWQSWKAKVTGELLAAAPCLLVPPSQEYLARRLEASVESYTAGNLSALARFLGVHIQDLWGYLHRGQIPYFDTLLKICSAFSLTPAEFLTATPLPPPPQEKPRFFPESVPMISKGKRKRVTGEDIQRMRQILEAILAVDYHADHVPNLREIAHRMGFHTATVQKHCPDLSQAVASRYKGHWNEEGNHARMKQALETSLAKAVPEPLEEVAQRLGCDAMTLRRHFPDLCRAIVTRNREHVDYACIEQRLREVLASEEEIPAVYAIAREMGYARHILYHNFTDLCQQISTRRYAQLRMNRQERMAVIGKEIRQVALQLHEQRVYPSSRQIAKRISDQHALRTKEGHEAWVSILQELGYPTDTLRTYE
jgi:DNA-binding transcriptional regulator YhcF (GntR family)